MRNVESSQLPIEVEPLESARARFGLALKVPIDVDAMTDEEAANNLLHMDRTHVFDLHVAGFDARYCFSRDVMEGKQYLHFTCSPNPDHMRVKGNHLSVLNLMFRTLYELTGARFKAIPLTIEVSEWQVQVLFDWAIFQRGGIVAKAGDN